MNQKVLIAYATRCGSTVEVAQAVAEELTKRGFAVDVRQAAKVTEIDGYTAVVVGSAVRFGSWMPEAVKFVEQNRAALNNLPTAFFAVHLMNMSDDDASRKARLAYLDPVRKLVSPKAEAFFPGVGDLSKVSFLERLIGKMVKSPEGDFRDWTKIRAWAQEIL
jgi:menaquinone-dependent protoporphyrinogen oxidase